MRYEVNHDDTLPYFDDDADCEAAANGWTGSGAVCYESLTVKGTPVASE